MDGEMGARTWTRDEKRMAWASSDGTVVTDYAIMNLPDALACELTLQVLGETATHPTGERNG